jgi:hypothetical protein
MTAAGLFGGFSSATMGSGSSFPFGIPSTTSTEEVKRESAPQSSGNSLDIPEFLNPKNRL